MTDNWKSKIVVGLERTCTVLDRATPDLRWRFPGRVCRLAEWSERLDHRWGTDVWYEDAGADR